MTLIIAHRGASGYKPEMTIPAYELALNKMLMVLKQMFV